MATWEEFAAEEPELAAFGAERLRQPVSYMATVRQDGSPRVHPLTPIIGGGRLFVFMEPTSPKGRDLRRDPRYMLHTLVVDQAGSNGEFLIRGRARLVDETATRQIATEAASYTPQDRYVLFELDVTGVMSTVYTDGGPVRRRWGLP